MDNPIIQALRRARQAYMTNVGEPTAQLVGGGVRGYLGLDAPDYADSRGMEAYRNAAAISNTPVVGMPSMAVRAGAKAAPAIAQSLREHAKGFQEYNRALGPAGASQMVVWHGSPHKFDAFDASKIGTGEGAQAYGHGLYLAESPEVAKEYQRALGTGIDLEGKPVMRGGKLVGTTGNRLLDSNMELYAGNLNQGIKDQLSILRDKRYRLSLADDKNSWAYKANKEVLKDEQKQLAAMRNLRNNGTFINDGSLYKVDLPDPMIARMLDWDKPLSEQHPDVQKALETLGYKYDQQAATAHDDALLGALFGDSTAAVPKMQSNPMGSDIARGKGIFDQPQDKVIAEKLRQAGIPGIRYLDQASRAAGQGTSNFVVFPGEEAALTILERNNEIINALRKKKQQ